MIETNHRELTRFGFGFGRGGAHLARTMMLAELRTVLSYVSNPEAVRADYRRAINEDNCLGKRSGKTRRLTYRDLAYLYSLDPSATLFRTLLFFWRRDMQGQPLLALLCAYSRDAILRSTASFILGFPEGTAISRSSLEEVIDSQESGRFSKITLTSVAQRVNSTWTQSGHLRGHAGKIRARAEATSGATAYALLLGYLTGARGKALFETDYAKLIDCSIERAIELAEEASQRGWIVFKRVGDVMEVLFPSLLTAEEMGWIREQSRTPS